MQRQKADGIRATGSFRHKSTGDAVYTCQMTSDANAAAAGKIVLSPSSYIMISVPAAAL